MKKPDTRGHGNTIFYTLEWGCETKTQKGYIGNQVFQNCYLVLLTWSGWKDIKSYWNIFSLAEKDKYVVDLGVYIDTGEEKKMLYTVKFQGR